MGGVHFELCLLLFSGLLDPQGYAKSGPRLRGCDRTGPTGASPMGPGPTERDPGPGRDSTWDPLNALGPTEPGPTEPKLKPPARVVTAGSGYILVRSFCVRLFTADGDYTLVAAGGAYFLVLSLLVIPDGDYISVELCMVRFITADVLVGSFFA